MSFTKQVRLKHLSTGQYETFDVAPDGDLELIVNSDTEEHEMDITSPSGTTKVEIVGSHPRTPGH